MPHPFRLEIYALDLGGSGGDWARSLRSIPPFVALIEDVGPPGWRRDRVSERNEGQQGEGGTETERPLILRIEVGMLAVVMS